LLHSQERLAVFGRVEEGRNRDDPGPFFKGDIVRIIPWRSVERVVAYARDAGLDIGLHLGFVRIITLGIQRLESGDEDDRAVGEPEIEVSAGSLARVIRDDLDPGQLSGVLDVRDGQVFIIGAALTGQPDDRLAERKRDS
jgi:hypothetical protein